MFCRAFVVLKDRTRNTHDSCRIALLFRYHARHRIQLPTARFRHTFASDMVRAGMSFRSDELMGHADIETTLRYVQVTPQDVYFSMSRGGQCIAPSRNPS